MSVRTRTPLALKAVTSCSEARRPKACSVDMSTAIGSVMAKREGERQHEELADHPPRQALAHQLVELPGHVLEQQQRCQRGQREQERPHMLAHDVAGDDPHGMVSGVRKAARPDDRRRPQPHAGLPGCLEPPGASRSIHLNSPGIHRIIKGQTPVVLPAAFPERAVSAPFAPLVPRERPPVRLIADFGVWGGRRGSGGRPGTPSAPLAACLMTLLGAAAGALRAGCPGRCPAGGPAARRGRLPRADRPARALSAGTGHARRGRAAVRAAQRPAGGPQRPPREQGGALREPDLHRRAARAVRLQLLPQLPPGVRLSGQPVVAGHRGRPRLRGRAVRLAEPVRRLQQHLPLLPGAARRAAAARGSGQRELRRAHARASSPPASRPTTTACRPRDSSGRCASPP